METVRRATQKQSMISGSIRLTLSRRTDGELHSGAVAGTDSSDA
jgi:hypothetical protein